MDSDSLSRKWKVKEWFSLSSAAEKDTLDKLPEEKGVFVILLSDREQQGRAQSDIAYVGAAANEGGLRNRVRQIFHPGLTQTTNKRIQDNINEGCAVKIGVIQSGSPAELRDDLLRRFTDDHGILPKLHGRAPVKRGPHQ